MSRSGPWGGPSDSSWAAVSAARKRSGARPVTNAPQAGVRRPKQAQKTRQPSIPNAAQRDKKGCHHRRPFKFPEKEGSVIDVDELPATGPRPPAPASQFPAIDFRLNSLAPTTTESNRYPSPNLTGNRSDKKTKCLPATHCRIKWIHRGRNRLPQWIQMDRRPYGPPEGGEEKREIQTLRTIPKCPPQQPKRTPPPAAASQPSLPG